MAEDFYGEMIDMAKEMIAEFGRTVTFRQIRGTAPDPDKPWIEVPLPPVDYPDVWMCPLPTDRYAFESFGFPAREDIALPHGFELGFLAAQVFKPNLKDLIVIGSRAQSIENMIEIGPDGRDVLYILLLSK